jgi:hypothetical protein
LPVKVLRAAEIQVVLVAALRVVVAHLLKALTLRHRLLLALLAVRVQLPASRAVLSLTLVAVAVVDIQPALAAQAVLVLVALVETGE